MHVKSVVGAMSSKFPVNNTSEGTLAKWWPRHLSEITIARPNVSRSVFELTLRLSAKAHCVARLTLNTSHLFILKYHCWWRFTLLICVHDCSASEKDHISGVWIAYDAREENKNYWQRRKWKTRHPKLWEVAECERD